MCDNKYKIGKEIYGIKMDDYTTIEQINNPQIIIAVASPAGQFEIQKELKKLKLNPGRDYWFFS